jgi:hypothetical protein
LGLPWTKKQNVWISPEPALYFKDKGIIVPSVLSTVKASLISAASFSILSREKYRKYRTEVFTASMADIEKALKPKTRTDPRTKLLSHYYEFLEVFNQTEAKKLPPLYRPDMDH